MISKLFKGVIIVSVFVAGSCASDMFPAIVGKDGVMKKNFTIIEDAKKIKEFGLYRADKKTYPTKMRIREQHPCFIIDPSEWAGYKKIDTFTVEVVQLDRDFAAGFVGYGDHAPVYYNDDLPQNPLYLLGKKGCSEVPNTMTITAYQIIGGDWVETGKATFILKK